MYIAGHRVATCDMSMSTSFARTSPTQNYLERVVLHMTHIGTGKPVETGP